MATTKKPAKKPAPQSPGTVNTDGLKVTDTTVKICKPFVVQVMVFAPGSGFKMEVNIEKSCTPDADAVWKLVFDLYKKKKNADGFDQLVHVSFTGGTPVEKQGLEATSAKGVNSRQADVIVNRAGPAVLDLQNSQNMSPAELNETLAEVKGASKDVATFALS
ncbi:MAG TPA: hypothetical protein VF546_01425 [Pyrinomonadaceae bacterium]|jgi:hypothetical protein